MSTCTFGIRLSSRVHAKTANTTTIQNDIFFKKLIDAIMIGNTYIYNVGVSPLLHMKRTNLCILLFVLFLSGAPSAVYGQTKAIEEQEKRQKKQKKSSEKAEEEARERHLKIQDKETRKRMKRSLKEAERRKKGKNPVPWYRRIFNKKRKKRRYRGEK